MRGWPMKYFCEDAMNLKEAWCLVAGGLGELGHDEVLIEFARKSFWTGAYAFMRIQLNILAKFEGEPRKILLSALVDEIGNVMREAEGVAI